MTSHRIAAWSAAALAVALVAGCASSGGDAPPGPTATSTSTAAPSPPSTTSTDAPTSSTTTVATAPVGGRAAIEPAVDPVGAVRSGSIETADGRTRTYRVYVPASVASHPDQPVPLLLALHGGLGWGAQYEKNSGFDGLAEANGFLVAYPDGFDVDPGSRQVQTWNGGACCGPAVRLDVDDVGFVRQLIAQLEDDYAVGPGQVVAAGHSNGGILALRLGCELADEISAVGVQSSALEVEDCAPSQPVSLIQIHGTADQNVPIDGGIGSEAVSGVDFRPPADAARTYARVDGCPDPATLAVDGNADLAVTSWAPCEDGAAVAFVRVDGATHAWMGPPRGAGGLTGPPYEDLDSSFVIWNFLSQHLRG